MRPHLPLYIRVFGVRSLTISLSSVPSPATMFCLLSASVCCLVTVAVAQQTALLTGGFNGYEGSRAGCELLNGGCAVPALTTVTNITGGSGRPDREDHVTAVTEDGLVLTCGGEAGDGTDDLSCIALDVGASTWSFHSVLSGPRIKATSVGVPGVGLYVIGGFKQLSTELLPVGADTWQPGPTLPGTEETDYYGICSLLLSTTEFMVIGGNGEGLFGGTRVQVGKLPPANKTNSRCFRSAIKLIIRLL